MIQKIKIALILLVAVSLGCSSNSNTATPPSGAILTESQIQDQNLEITEETFGRPVPDGEEPKK